MIMVPQPSIETNSLISTTHSPEIFDKGLSSDSSPNTEPSVQGSLTEEQEKRPIIIQCDQRFLGVAPHAPLVTGKSNPDGLNMPHKYAETIPSDNIPLVNIEGCITDMNKQTFDQVWFLLKVSQE